MRLNLKLGYRGVEKYMSIRRDRSDYRPVVENLLTLKFESDVKWLLKCRMIRVCGILK